MNYDYIKEKVESYKNEGKSLPCTAENENGELVVISEGQEDGTHFFELYVCQDNDAGRINTYYADGTITEEYDIPAVKEHDSKKTRKPENIER